MKEYSVKITVRNNLLLKAIEAAGYKTQADFAKANNISAQYLNSLVAMRTAPISKQGYFTDLAKQLMEILGACPTDLWTEEQLNMELKNNSSILEINKEALLSVLDKTHTLDHFEDVNPETLLEKKQLKNSVHKLIDKSLPLRYKQIIALQYGLDNAVEHSFIQIGDSFDVSGTRARQLSIYALERLKRHISLDNSDFLMTDIKSNNCDSSNEIKPDECHNSDHEISNYSYNSVPVTDFVYSKPKSSLSFRQRQELWKEFEGEFENWLLDKQNKKEFNADV